MQSPPYKSKGNAWLTRALFWDIWVTQPVELRVHDPIFTFHQDKEGYINGRKTFVECGDPTGYRWAVQYLGDWDHFLALEKANFFKPVLAKWRAELQMKMTSEAIDRIKVIAESDDKQALVANKYLADRTWERAGANSGRGRPSKAELAGELKRAVQMVEVEDEDMERMGLRAVK